MKPNTQLNHLLRAAALDQDHATELLVFMGASICVDTPDFLPLNTDNILFLACSALSAADVHELGLRNAFRRCYALTVFQRSQGSYQGGDPEDLASYDEIRFAAEDWLSQTDAELLGMILAHKILGRFVGNCESFHFSLKPLSPWDCRDRAKPAGDGKD